MKASWWKYVCLALITAGVVACGSDNKTNTDVAATNAIGTGGVLNPVSTSTYSEFRNQVVAGNFQAITNGLVYVVYNGMNINYEWKGGFLGCKYTNGSLKERAYNQGNYTHEYGSTPQAIVAGISAIVNAPQAYVQLSGTRWRIYHGGYHYEIDTSRPLVANPVSKVADGTQSGCVGSGYLINTSPSISY